MHFMLPISFIVTIACLSGTDGALRSTDTTYCVLPQNSENLPLIETTWKSYISSNMHLELKRGDQFTASCNTSTGFVGLGEKTLSMTCVYGTIVNTPFGLRNFSDFLCKPEGRAGEIVTRTGTCYNNYTQIDISFSGANPPYTLLTICHDENLDETLYTMHYIFGARLNESESGTRPSFKEGDFYSEINTDDCYKQVTQTETIGMLLNSTSLAEHYIQTGTNLFLSRGHLTPNGDPIKAVEKSATFYFINVSPQWQTINGGNWNQLEIKTRDLAGKRRETFTVWTGSFGVLTLDDVSGKPVEIWLGRDIRGVLLKKLPVNKYTWKVIFDETANQAIAVIQINNPWHGVVTDEDIFCPNICNQLSWVTWNTQDIRLGYTFCCDVESFKKAIPYAPSFLDVDLLN